MKWCDEKYKGYTYLTGSFTHCSASGHDYLLVRYNYDANEILVEPLKELQVKTIAEGWENINQQFATARVQPHTHVLDNEVSNKLNRSLEKYTINYLLVPPHSHWAKKAKHVIQKFKYHLKARLDTFDP